MEFNRKYIRRKATLIIIYPFLGVIIGLFRVLPIGWIRRFALFVGALVYRYAHSSRERALANLERVYGGEKTREERIAMARQVFAEMIKSFFDYVAYSGLTDRERFFFLVEVVGQEHLQAAYERGKGVICLVPHLSSWEFAAITPPMLGYETSAASAAMKIKPLQNKMVKYRARRGMKNINREGSYAKLVETLRKGECLILMIDQDTKVKSAFVEFMGKPAYTPTGASRLALETGALVVPMVMTRKEDDNYRFIIYPELPLVNTGNPEADILENTRRQTKIMEDMVRAYPTQWVWMHSRWNTTPEKLEAYRKSKREEKKEG
ncbi:MAG: lysophospholipid acyltransferase family protein [Tannerellaceae bacterium]|jgi:KDO2-lipid IV(A) lauroyltransferase|nr:lysophospholipid acyltransferase family protein [Tannerellaceae bacterium]